ncbi:transposase, partial [Pectobacterium brasiliense]|nr:transposase [Pectobacterium brasiliense]
MSGREHSPEQSIRAVTAISTCIKKSRKAESITIPAAVLSVSHRSATDAQQPKSPGLFSAAPDEFKPREVMRIYSRRMQIEQNFRDEKSERFGFGL